MGITCPKLELGQSTRSRSRARSQIGRDVWALTQETCLPSRYRMDFGLSSEQLSSVHGERPAASIILDIAFLSQVLGQQKVKDFCYLGHSSTNFTLQQQAAATKNLCPPALASS